MKLSQLIEQFVTDKDLKDVVKSFAKLEKELTKMGYECKNPSYYIKDGVKYSSCDLQSPNKFRELERDIWKASIRSKTDIFFKENGVKKLGDGEYRVHLGIDLE